MADLAVVLQDMGRIGTHTRDQSDVLTVCSLPSILIALLTLSLVSKLAFVMYRILSPS
jgi:hypothetical protein